MKIQFDANQDYQLEAVQSVLGLFEGQPDASQGIAAFEQDAMTSLALTERGIANRCVLTDKSWLKNLNAVQRQHGLDASTALEGLQDSDGNSLGSFPNFTVEMETGTGKTYVYLRTIHELHRNHGFRKFVIVVPSVAIREGVMKSLEITKEHFQTLYGRPRMETLVYDASRVNQLRNFALSDALQILVINIDAFAKDADETTNTRSKGNVINQLRETGMKPIEFIQATNPIVIMDEPQNMETDKRKAAIARLNPMCTLRYSATHRETYNLIYKLDPVNAYEKGLVKQISVDSVLDMTSANQAYVELEGFKTGARSISAKVSIWVNQASGPKKKRITVKNGDDLYKKSNEREIYKDGYIVNEIDAERGLIRFANDVVARIGVPHGALTEQIMKLQIEATVKRHFEKAEKLEKIGIKVLSVFFIDRVSSYRIYNADGTTTPGPFARWFEEIYQKYQQKEEFQGIYTDAAASVHNGYFARDKNAVSPFGEEKFKTKKDAEGGAYELIMRDKERLLDQAEPLRFIFSHSALREGWDNTNVFQICTLAESASELKKRQEIGRGLRLCVNQEGERVWDRSINRLTVIANETYEDFARQLQTELEDAGYEFRQEMVQREREKVKLRLRKGYEADPQFLELWEKIRQKTKYRVSYSSSELISKAVETLQSHDAFPPLPRPRVALTRADISVSREGVGGVETGRRSEEIEARFVMPDFIEQIQGKTGLSKSTVAEVLLSSGRLQDALNNPQVFIDHVANLINAVKREFLVADVEYQKIAGKSYEMKRFEDQDLMEVFKSNVEAVNKSEKTLFNYIEIDSNSTPERQFAQDCDNNENVLFYIKLPRWFQIDTPVGTYNPDWALAYQNDETLYFVAETKGKGQATLPALDALRPIEELKIRCGKRHFRNFEKVQFKVVGRVSELI
jgi:type III restriction enzyme